ATRGGDRERSARARGREQPGLTDGPAAADRPAEGRLGTHDVAELVAAGGAELLAPAGLDRGAGRRDADRGQDRGRRRGGDDREVLCLPLCEEAAEDETRTCRLVASP